jgi:ectoine hydroxylase-related dioxygenase (phytanoyl-CoA dioxygenase family)
MISSEQKHRLHEDGFCIVPGALSAGQLDRVRMALDEAVEITRAMLGSTHIRSLDPNDANIRVNNLPAMDAVFIELLTRPDALAMVHTVLGEHVLVSNFTANIALPGSGSMRLHSDQALVVPPPWPQPWALNIIWCLDDVHEANGATRYLPGSHRFQSPADIPNDAMEHTLPFEAPAGSFVAMEGRLWHTSGCNRTDDEQRRMLFAYYASDFLRQQMNWAVTLPDNVQAGMNAEARALFGLGPMGNTRIGAQLTSLEPTA